mgnify:CR=1 FL=1
MTMGSVLMNGLEREKIEEDAKSGFKVVSDVFM